MNRPNYRKQRTTQEQMDTIYQKNQILMERDPDLYAFKTLLWSVEKRLSDITARLERIAQ